MFRYCFNMSQIFTIMASFYFVVIIMLTMKKTNPCICACLYTLVHEYNTSLNVLFHKRGESTGDVLYRVV